jgi:hypothetical protein
LGPPTAPQLKPSSLLIKLRMIGEILLSPLSDLADRDKRDPDALISQLLLHCVLSD